jgi:hypothetical protein
MAQPTSKEQTKPKWYVKAKDRMTLMKRLATGTDVHLLEMACTDYDKLQRRVDELSLPWAQLAKKAQTDDGVEMDVFVARLWKRMEDQQRELARLSINAERAAHEPGAGWQGALIRKALSIADEHFGYPERGPAVDLDCKCSYCRYARVRGMMTAPTKCGTCNDRGEVGGFLNADSGYQTDPCPDCSGTTKGSAP